MPGYSLYSFWVKRKPTGGGGDKIRPPPHSRPRLALMMGDGCKESELMEGAIIIITLFSDWG